MSFASSLNMLELLRPSNGEGSASKRSAHGSGKDGERFDELLKQEKEAARPQPVKRLALPDFLPVFALNLPSVTSLPQPQAVSLPQPREFAGAKAPAPSEAAPRPEASTEPRPQPQAGKPEPGTKPDPAGQNETAKLESRDARPDKAQAAEAEARDKAASETRPEKQKIDEEKSDGERKAELRIKSLGEGAEAKFDIEEDGEPADEATIKKLSRMQAAAGNAQANAASQADASNHNAQASASSAQAVQNPSSTAATTGATPTAAATTSGTTNTPVQAPANTTAPNGGAEHSAQQVTPAATATGGADATRGNAKTGLPSDTASTPRSETLPVPKQVLQSLSKAIQNGDREIQLRLDPPELGDVKMNLRMDGDHLRVMLEASSAAARKALEESLPELRQMLQQDGFKVSEFVIQDRAPEDGSDPREQWAEHGGDGSLDDEEAEEGALASEQERAQLAAQIFNQQQVNMVA